jgi:tRNA(Ile)-lysidine synthase
LADLAERFERACRLLRLPIESGSLVVAASGGADSAAALVLLRRVAPHAKIVACYVDHGLRPPKSIARDIAAVRTQSRSAKAKTIVRRVRLDPAAGSPEERARRARYDELAQTAREVGATHVVTGHQQDDLAETSLLALMRGSGIDGVAAMRPLRRLADGVALARPLLWATKAQCADLLGRMRIAVSEDETNADRRIPRNAVRALVATIEQILPGTSRGIARSAALLADDKDLLERLSAAAWQQSRIEGSQDLSSAALRRLPIGLLRRVIRHAVATLGVGLRDFSFVHCNAIARAIKEGRGGRYHAGRATVVLSAGTVSVEGARASGGVSGVQPHETIAIDVEKPERRLVTPFGIISLRRVARMPAQNRSKKKEQHLDLDGLRSAGLVEVRLPRPGDACVPSGRSRPVSLARFLGKSGVPKSRRERIALLCAGGRIAAVLGLRVMEPFRPKGRGPVLEVGWHATDM